MEDKQRAELLTVKEVADYLRMGLLTTYKLVNEGKLPAFKVGRQWRVKKDDLQHYIETQKLAPRKQRGKVKQRDIMEYLDEKPVSVLTEQKTGNNISVSVDHPEKGK